MLQQLCWTMDMQSKGMDKRVLCHFCSSKCLIGSYDQKCGHLDMNKPWGNFSSSAVLSSIFYLKSLKQKWQTRPTTFLISKFKDSRNSIILKKSWFVILKCYMIEEYRRNGENLSYCKNVTLLNRINKFDAQWINLYD